MDDYGDNDVNANVTRETVLKLMEQKDKIENEIGQMSRILETNGVGMHDTLVDENDFPRTDIDIYQVRHARHRIICLQNDHKTIMKEIEQGLHALHAQQRAGIGTSTDVEMRDVSPSLEPIARVNIVTEGSPAAESGLQLEDLIIEFGSVNAGNFSSLNDIAKVVQHSVGQPIVVKVKRKDAVQRLTVTPRTWSGRGQLLLHKITPGCMKDSSFQDQILESVSCTPKQATSLCSSSRLIVMKNRFSSNSP